MKVATDKINEGAQFSDFADMTIDVYGEPSAAVLEQLGQMADSGVSVRVSSVVA